jgi:hypothetical protein
MGRGPRAGLGGWRARLGPGVAQRAGWFDLRRVYGAIRMAP